MELNTFSTSLGSAKKRPRGSTTYGRGQKGQKSRSGASDKLGFNGGALPFYLRIPKRGFIPFVKRQLGINLRSLQSLLEKHDEITRELLAEHQLMRGGDKVKIFGDSSLLTKKVSFVGFSVTQSIRDRVESLGGVIK